MSERRIGEKNSKMVSSLELANNVESSDEALQKQCSLVILLKDDSYGLIIQLFSEVTFPILFTLGMNASRKMLQNNFNIYTYIH